MKISLIVACDMNGVIGNKGQIPWNLKTDMKRFREFTTGKVVVMGRKTFESIGKALPNRTNVVLTRKLPEFFHSSHEISSNVDTSLYYRDSLTSAIKDFEHEGKEVVIIGGAEIYMEALRSLPIDQILVTIVRGEFEGDAKIDLTAIDEKIYNFVDSEHFVADEKNSHNFSFYEFVRTK